MKISVELTLAPFQNEYKSSIRTFINQLKASGLEVSETPLSTQVYGDYDKVMSVLTVEVKEILELVDKGIVLIKILK